MGCGLVGGILVMALVQVPRWALSLWSLHVLRLHASFLQALQLPPTVHKCESFVNWWLIVTRCKCRNVCDELASCTGSTPPSTTVNGIGSSNAITLKGINWVWKMDGL